MSDSSKCHTKIKQDNSLYYGDEMGRGGCYTPKFQKWETRPACTHQLRRFDLTLITFFII